MIKSFIDKESSNSSLIVYYPQSLKDQLHKFKTDLPWMDIRYPKRINPCSEILKDLI